MRHYEIVFLVNPNEGDSVPAMIEKYRNVVLSDGGKIHRLEEWGRRELAYPIQNHKKAYYVLMNIESSLETLRQIENFFRFSDLVLRSLVVKKSFAETEDSFVVLEQKKESKENKPETDRSAAQPERNTTNTNVDENESENKAETEQESPQPEG